MQEIKFIVRVQRATSDRRNYLTKVDIDDGKVIVHTSKKEATGFTWAEVEKLSKSFNIIELTYKKEQ